MKSFRIKNLRSIKDSNNIDIGGCNFFIGANGTGKSSILRFFPLIKQTVSQKNSAPILWYAKDGVDFGSYAESVNKTELQDGITFMFHFDEEVEISSELISEVITDTYLNKNKSNPTIRDWLMNINRFRWFFRKHLVKFQKIELSTLDNKFSKIVLFFDGQEIEFNFLENKIIVNREKIQDLYLLDVKKEYPLIPYVFVKNNNKIVDIASYFAGEIIKLLQNDTNPNIAPTTWVQIFEKINYYRDKEAILNRLKSPKLPKTLTNKFLDFNSSASQSLHNYILIIVASRLIDEVNQLITDYFKNTIYIAPIRATAERYYRVQGLSVEEVDPMGINVPMILDYMHSNIELEKSWQEWTMASFNTKYRANTEGGNTSIEVFIDGRYYNLADTGFGYSQFLPILLMLWQEEQIFTGYNNDDEDIFSFSEKKFKPRKMIIIEQPELHLHPRMQTQFADLLFDIVTRAKNSVNFIIETHSITIINRIGELIEQQNLKGNSVGSFEEKFNLYLVNNDSDKKIVKTQYDKEGVIKEWPIGFL